MLVLSATKKNKADKGIEGNRQIILFLDLEFKEGLSTNESFEQKYERRKKLSHAVIQGKAFPRGSYYKRKGSVGRACVKCLRNRREFSVAAAW